MLLTEEEIKRGPFHRNSVGMPDDPVGGILNGPVGLDIGDRLVAGAPDGLRRGGPDGKEGEDGEEKGFIANHTFRRCSRSFNHFAKSLKKPIKN